MNDHRIANSIALGFLLGLLVIAARIGMGIA